MGAKINVIGTPSIEIDGKSLRLPVKKAEAMIYYLAVEKTASREKLASLFWGTKDGGSAYNNFRNVLYLLKRNFPDGCVIADRRSVVLKDVKCDLQCLDKIEDVKEPLPQFLTDEMLAGVDVPDSADFSNWLLPTRSHFKAATAEKIRNRLTL